MVPKVKPMWSEPYKFDISVTQTGHYKLGTIKKKVTIAFDS